MNDQSPAVRVAAASGPVVLRERLEDIAVLTLNRPEQRNSLSEDMLAALGEAFASIATDSAIRVVVLAASGAAFSAGHDLKELTSHRADPDRGRAYTKRLMDTCSAMMQDILRLPQPVIAAVEGTATAAGCQLVATCDLAVASTAARFCTPGVHIGLFCTTPMVALTRDVGRKHAMEMLLTGEMISGEEAYRMGLVNRVVAPGAARDEAVKLARKIAAKSSTAVKFGKEAFYRQLEMNVDDAYRHAAEVMVENMLAGDAKEGISAFIEKRPPEWEDR